MPDRRLNESIEYAKILATKNGWTTPEHWNNLRQNNFEDKIGQKILGKYRRSPWKFIIEVVAPYIYPNYLYLEWKIGYQAPNGFWKDPEKVRFCLDVLAGYENFTSLDGFYGVSQATYKKHGVSSIQNKFGSHLGMLKFAYQEKNWKEWKFRPVTRGFWNVRENVISAVKDIEHELGILEPSGWYKYTVATIDKYCGEGLISNKYQWSLLALLKDVYPDYPWKPYMLEKAPHKYWQNDDNCREWLSDYMEFRGYKKIEDLYKTRYESLIEYTGGRSIIDRFGGSYIQAFIHLHPELDVLLFYKAGVSKIANEWLLSQEEQEGPLEREYRIPGTGKKWKVDGFNHAKKRVYEFLGDYWHGNPSKYNSDDINPSTCLTYGVMYTETMKRLDYIRELGYEVIYIWECEWKGK